MTSSENKAQAAKNACRRLNITLAQLSEKFDAYNKRVSELNEVTVEFARNFIAPKGKTGKKGELIYDLNDDDKTILLAYKKKAANSLADEFPDILEVMDDLKIFEVDIELTK